MPKLDDLLLLAQACLAQGNGTQALALMAAADQAYPDNAAVLCGLGVALRFVARLNDAAEAFERAARLDPQRTDAPLYLGMIRLAQGRQREGWPLYQARWRHAGWTTPMRYPVNMLWKGAIDAGGRVLFWGEQGFGDCLQFARYMPWLLQQLHAQGGSMMLEVPGPLCSLLRTSWPFMDIVEFGAASGHFDAHLPLMELPMLWGGQVGGAGLPHTPFPVPYLSALPDLHAAQRGARPPCASSSSALNPSARSVRVGIVWQGRPTHPGDAWRSMRSDDFQLLFEVPGITWVSLQKDAADQPSWLPDDLKHCHDFLDTARIVDGLDLIISIDSAVAHLAGALGKPVWVLLPLVADWRWGVSGASTPWYPTMRLFRQQHSGSWTAPLQDITTALIQMTKEAPA